MMKMTEVGGRGCGDNGRAKCGGESMRDAAKTQDNISNKNRVFCSSRPTFKKVQVVYYLSRNGLLEHPHYMEVTHLAHRHLLLKDVMDRLTALRGKGMPSLYSWSCKRSYKNGYVWNDLAENDVIYPCEGSEYILKGSELVQGSSEKFKMLQVSNSQQFQLVRNAHDGGDFLPKRKPVAAKQYPEPEEVQNNNYGEEDEDEEEEYEEKTSYSNCSATENQLRVLGVEDKNGGELTRDDSSSPSTTSSSLSEKANNASKRFEHGDSSLLSRNSVLFQLISCGGSASFRGKTIAPFTKQAAASVTVGRKSCSGSSLQKEVLIRAAAAARATPPKATEDEEEIKYMSENPRFGNMQSEEKEYFSGSIVESITTEQRAEINPVSLKKSNSYNEERSCKAGLGDGAEKEGKRRGKGGGTTGKCIPIKKSSSKHSKK
ncbi:PREDICTED: protein UPSTREAM OF FLC [Ipomoea nil]|uniref:protein UPSTREAM OF FLC n=1 Tax=Ipomoea nil TaxID=35883 RepID=UPI000900BDD6|nr:PREDICTED: protein UPSTREAM OF FLC [Ipomoea nil]